MKRYTAVSDSGERVGLFHILNLLEEQDMTPSDAGDLEYAERILNLNLPVPPYPDGIRTEAWFTEYGAEHFKEAVGIIGRLVNCLLDGYGYVFHEEFRSGDGREIMYRDRYQVIFVL